MLPNPPQAKKAGPLNNIRVTQSVLGSAIPIVMGQQRVPMKLLWYGDFLATPHTNSSSGNSGGKGLFGGGGGNNAGTTYTYQAAVIAALCQGVCVGIASVWDSKGKFIQTSATENFTIPGGGGTYTVTHHALFGQDNGAGYAAAYSHTVNDYGSPGPATLSGTQQNPFTQVVGTPGPGQYSVNPATGVYTFNAADAGKVASITYSYNLLQEEQDETDTIPGTPYQIGVQQALTYYQNVSVNYFIPGTGIGAQLTQVSGSPAVGQYSVNTSTGVYTFAAGDSGQSVIIKYTTLDPNTNQTAPTALNFTFYEGLQSQAADGYMTSKHPAQALGYTEIAYIISQAMQLGTTAALPNYTFEILGPYSFGNGIVDCVPTANIKAILTDPFFGIGFPAGNLGNWSQALAFWAANSFFISPLLDNQKDASSWIGDWLESGQVAAYWSEGMFKLMPYGDTSAVGNGQFYQPITQPVVDLSDDDFLDTGAGQDPVTVARTPWQDAYNRVQVEWYNRANHYSPEITPEQDDAAILRYGLRTENPQAWHHITTLAAATMAANLRVRRNVNIRNTYTFHLGWNYSYLEPMDLVTVTVTRLGLVGTPVRIVKIVDDPVKGLEITAEDFPWGTATATLFPKQTGLGFNPTAGQADPGNTTALIFEAPNRLGLQAGNVLYIFCSGSIPAWGGCTIWISFDGTTYSKLAVVTSPARTGTLLNNIAAGGSDPDNTNVPQIQVPQASVVLPTVSSADADQFVSLCAIANPSGSTFELLAYTTATLVGQLQYNLSRLHRGVYQTTNQSHAIGEIFARLDQASAQYQYDPSYYGKTISFKFTSFNTLGGKEQSLASVAAQTFTLQGAGPGAIDLNAGNWRLGQGAVPQSWSGTITWSSAVPGTSLVVTWNINVNRGTMPTPSQPNNTLVVVNYNSSQTITGLTASTNYWLYPYLDDSLPTSPFKFSTNSDVAGAVGTPAIAYTALTANATYFTGRNDHLPLNAGPLAVTTAPGTGSGTGGSGAPVGGPCPRGDMVVLRKKVGAQAPSPADSEIVRIDQIAIGDFVRGRDGWVEVLDLVHGWSNDWTIVLTDCGEEIAVTAEHTWPTPDGEFRTPELGIGSRLILEDGKFTEVIDKRADHTPHLPVGLVVDGDQCYLIGSKRPRVLTHNSNVLPRS